MDLYRWASRILPYVPPTIGYPLCERLAFVARWLPGWQQVLANLRQVLPDVGDGERVRCARGVFANLLKNYYDLLRLHAISPATLADAVETRGLENLVAALARGKGAVVAIPHLGNISFLPEPLSDRLGRPILTVVEQLADPEVQAFFTALRARKGAEILPIGPGTVRRLIEALREGSVVALASDRTVATATVNVCFFGGEVAMPAGAATLALRTGAPLLTAYTYRKADNRCVVVIDPPLDLQRRTVLAADVHRVMQVIARIFESYIRRRPAQWLITTPVWATP